MMLANKLPHIPVLCREVIDLLDPHEGGHYLDGTLGYAGHASALLERAPQAFLLGIDRDLEALSLAKKRLAPHETQIHLVHGCYGSFPEYLAQVGWTMIDGALIDIGVSSMQLDQGERGFSFNADAPLDMRMDRSSGDSVADLVNEQSFEFLRDAIARFGEEPKAAVIAKNIVRQRQQKPIRTTGELAAIVAESYPKAWLKTARHHPATRTFQALRMIVNDELGELERFLACILDYLPKGGRLCVLTFHSLEDRLVKQAMSRWAKGCLCPAYTVSCHCGHVPEAKLLTKKPLRATPSELASNPRASSAKLRAIEKL